MTGFVLSSAARDHIKVALLLERIGGDSGAGGREVRAQVRYYHGGPPGIRGEILPPERTKVPSTADYGAGAVCRRDRVYVTTNPVGALIFAAGAPSNMPGWIYEVVPFGEIEPDEDYNGPAGESVCCCRARIRRVHLRLSLDERSAVRRVLGMA